jgi:catechol 2,3-dioxygenase-like lactoylglutathione lyase family enzyme
MIGYVTLGTNDLERAKTFYDTVLAELAGKRTTAFERMQLWGLGRGPMLAVCTPFDEKTATHGNGTMVALSARSREQVDKVHKKAMEAGASDEGAPGLRGDDFYGAYFRDPDGNKICIFRTGT